MTETEVFLSERLKKKDFIHYLVRYPERFEEVVAIAKSPALPLCWRACWMLFHHCEKNDIRLFPHIDGLISAISNKEDGHQRELIKLIGKMKLTEEQEGMMFDACMIVWESVKKIPSVRMMAFHFIMGVVKTYPELREELEFTTQSHFLETLSPGIRNSVMKQIKRGGLNIR